MSELDAPYSGEHDRETEIEATGETVGEAKWSALRELERRFPGLEKSSVDFVVLSEGERGLLGVGFVPARVIARVEGAVATAAPPEAPSPASDPKTPAADRLRELLDHVRKGLGIDVSLSITDQEGVLVGTFSGADLGLVIGKHGQTIDALQYLANAVLSRAADDRVDVVLDAAGYRDRRRTTLESLADRAAARVVATGSAVALDPMTASERKIVHLYLKERPGVVTSSEGAEPNRYVVVHPPGDASS